jgi:hypothetical protein
MNIEKKRTKLTDLVLDELSSLGTCACLRSNLTGTIPTHGRDSESSHIADTLNGATIYQSAN